MEQQSEIDRIKRWNKWFYDRVRYMRECQRQYFKARKDNAPHDELEAILRKSKALIRHRAEN